MCCAASQDRIRKVRRSLLSAPPCRLSAAVGFQMEGRARWETDGMGGTQVDALTDDDGLAVARWLASLRPARHVKPCSDRSFRVNCCRVRSAACGLGYTRHFRSHLRMKSIAPCRLPRLMRASSDRTWSGHGRNGQAGLRPEPMICISSVRLFLAHDCDRDSCVTSARRPPNRDPTWRTNAISSRACNHGLVDFVHGEWDREQDQAGVTSGTWVAQ